MLCGDRAKIDSISGIAIVKSGFPIGLTPISFRFPVLGWFRMLKAPVFYPAARIISHFSPLFQTKNRWVIPAYGWTTPRRGSYPAPSGRYSIGSPYPFAGQNESHGTKPLPAFSHGIRCKESPLSLPARRRIARNSADRRQGMGLECVSKVNHGIWKHTLKAYSNHSCQPDCG